jgi:hypothetical protein
MGIDLCEHACPHLHPIWEQLLVRTGRQVPMNDPLATYLHDHLGGADMAIDLLQAMRDRQKDKSLSQLAEHVLAEVKQDRDTLQHLADTIGSGSNLLKEFTAWLGEKASRVKLGEGAAGEFGTFEGTDWGRTGRLLLIKRLAADVSRRYLTTAISRSSGKLPVRPRVPGTTPLVGPFGCAAFPLVVTSSSIRPRSKLFKCARAYLFLGTLQTPALL